MGNHRQNLQVRFSHCPYSLSGNGAFGAIGFFVAKISTEMAAHSIASNLNWMTYVIPMGIGSAASIRIGFLIGAGNLIWQSYRWAILKFAIGYALIVSVLLVAFRYQLVSVYTTDLAVTSVAGAAAVYCGVSNRRHRQYCQCLARL